MEIVMTVGTKMAAPATHIVWVAGYGLGCVALAIWVISSRQFAKGS